MTRVWTSALPLALLVGACASDASQLTIDPPEGTQQLELVVLSGPCPATRSLATGQYRCGGTLLYAENVANGASAPALPSIEGPHAIVVVASTESCGIQVACVQQQMPADVRIDAFTSMDACSELRSCSGDVCQFTMCGEPPLTLNGTLDDDDDGISNGFECCGSACVGMAEIPIRDCVDTDGDRLPDYVDPNSDDDGYADDEECGGSESDATFCDFDDSGVADFREPNPENDFDGDTIPDEVECSGFTAEVGDCIDSDCDGQPDYRDRDSDDDGRADSDECTCFADSCAGALAAACPDGDMDRVPDFQDRVDTPCTCMPSGFPASMVECAFDADGTYCAVIEFSFTAEVRDGWELTWLASVDDGPLPPVDLTGVTRLDALNVPELAKRVPDAAGCERGGTFAAAGELRSGGMARGYLVDLRGEGAAELLPSSIGSVLRTTLQGRFIYDADGEPVRSL